MDFVQFAESHGLIIRHLERDRWARVPTDTHPKKKNGAYFFAEQYGFVQDWATMDRVSVWQDGNERTEFEREAMRKRMEASRAAYTKERAEMRQKAAKKAEWILSQCEPDLHAYMDSKGLGDMRVNVWRKDGQEPLLVVPMMYRDRIAGCQLIGIDGQKKFLTGQRTNDCHFAIGKGGDVWLSEGFATAISLHKILSKLQCRHTVHATFSAGNLARFAQAWPTAMICADNDASGVGQGVAEKSGCAWWMPPTAGQDANDFLQEVGLFRTTQELKKFYQARRGG